MWLIGIGKLSTVQPNFKSLSKPNIDCNGVTTIPVDIADEGADTGDEFMVAKVIVSDAMQGSRSDLKLLRETRAESKAMIEKLRVLVSRAGKSA